MSIQKESGSATVDEDHFNQEAATVRTTAGAVTGHNQVTGKPANNDVFLIARQLGLSSKTVIETQRRIPTGIDMDKHTYPYRPQSAVTDRAADRYADNVHNCKIWNKLAA